jgi:hypothetical protein
MAQRFGGRHSPTNIPHVARPATPASPDGWTGSRRRRAGGRANLLFMAPAPLLLAAFGADPVGLGLYLGAFGTMMAAAWMTRDGLAAEDAFEARRTARRPALPRKMIGSALTGAGLGMAGAASGSAVAAAIFAVLGAGLHFLSFGPDPLRDKSATGVDGFQADRVARVVDEAERHLAAIRDAMAPLDDRALSDRVARFAAAVARMVRTVEEDPRDLLSARRYLGAYLLGARDATAKYAALASRGRDDGARGEFIALLDDLETGFGARTERMLRDDRNDLDVEMEVLRERLARDGVAVNAAGPGDGGPGV